MLQSLFHHRDRPDHPLVTIHWDIVTRADWVACVARGVRVPITQSYPYALAMRVTRGLHPRWGMIRVNGQDVGAVQVLIATIPGRWMEAVIVDRGPLWFADDVSPAWHHGFWQSFAQEFPRRLGRVRRVIAEVTAHEMPPPVWRDLGYRPRPALAPYQTAWVDVRGGRDAMQARLSKNWRYELRRAAQISVHFSSDPAKADRISVLAALHAADKGYRPPDGRFLAVLHRAAARTSDLVIVTAEDQAAGVFIRHGTSATWQTGWVAPTGRATNANYIMVMAALDHLAALGVTEVDVGGYNDRDAVGVRRFKQGLGGVDVTLVGAFK